jgi:hypothetical protein
MYVLLRVNIEVLNESFRAYQAVKEIRAKKFHPELLMQFSKMPVWITGGTENEICISGSVYTGRKRLLRDIS